MAWFIQFYREGKQVGPAMQVDSSLPGTFETCPPEVVEAAQWRLEQLHHVPHWSQAADRFEAYEVDWD